MRERFDAIIIGGGPAGAVSALLLSQHGWSVAVIEKRHRHQAKTCGQCLDASANAVLRRAGLLADVQNIAVGEVASAVIHLPHAAPLHWPMDNVKGEPSSVVPRSELDQLLLDRAERAGAQVFQSATARVCEPVQRGCVVRVADHTLRAPLLIGADGLRSSVAQAAGLAGLHRAGRKYGFSFRMPSEHVELIRGVTHMFVMDGGYLGVVHHGRDCLHIAALVGTKHSRSPAAFIRHVAAEFPLLSALVASKMQNFVAVGPMPCSAAAVANECVALVGDAAGYIEPFTGEGMTWALTSAELLADIIAPLAPGQWNAGAAATYRMQWQQFIARRQRFCRTLAWALERPKIMRPLMAITRHQPHLAQHMQRILTA